MHHCLGDGTANVLVARALFGTDARRAARRRAARPHRRPGRSRRSLRPCWRSPQGSARRVRGAVSAAVEAATHPQETLRTAGIMLAGAGMLASELLRTSDPRSPLKGDFGLAKRVAWSAPVALADVKGDRCTAGCQDQRRPSSRHDRSAAHLPAAARRGRGSHDGARDGAGGPAPAGARRTNSATRSASCCWNWPSAPVSGCSGYARPRPTWTH